LVSVNQNGVIYHVHVHCVIAFILLVLFAVIHNTYCSSIAIEFATVSDWLWCICCSSRLPLS